MILTASKNVNARLGYPSVNAPNPQYIVPGDTINAICRVLGDLVNGNNKWIVTDSNQFFSQEGFHVTNELTSLPFYTHTENTPPIFRDLELSNLWNISIGERLNVGIIDNGVYKHPALKKPLINLNPNVQFDNNSLNHATTMACIIAGNDPSNGIIGIAPNITAIYSYTLPEAGLTPQMLIEALELMEKNNVKLINISFGSDNQSFDVNTIQGSHLQKKIQYLSKNGFIVVCSTGNYYGYKRNFYPAAYENVISVTGFKKDLSPEISATFWDGVSISMCSDYYFDKNIFKKAKGTSSAAALITGCLACIYNKIESADKTAFLQYLFNKLPAISYQYEDHTALIPRFDTQNFIKHFNT